MEHKKDRISELPDPLLQHVLSFVPIKQVVQSSTLSKRWKHVWFTIPVLEFDKTFFESKFWCKDNKKARKIQTRRVDQILLNRRRMGLSINKFTLFMPLTRPKSVSQVVDPWIDYVVKSDVEELNLDFYDDTWKRYLYPLPQSVLLAKSITMLMLTGCSLESLSLSCDIKINFSSLKKLSLVNVRTDDQIIQTLLAGCPVIEDMSIEHCCGLKTIHFSGLSKLKFIELKLNDGLKKVKLEASNLCCLHIQEMTASRINMVHFKTLKMLKLSSRCITDNWLNCYISQLPLIEYLSLYGCQMLEKIKISSHSLKTLYLLLCKNLVEVQINDTPKLCELSYGGTSTISFSVNALPYLSEATYQMVSHSGPWDVQKIELLAKLSNSKLFNLRSIYSAKDIVIPKELKETLPSPSYNVKQFHLWMSKPFTTHEIVEIVDNLLWISPLPELLLITHSIGVKPWFETISFKFSYKNPILREENPSCCKFLPVPCWRHCLKTITIENFRASTNEETLKADEETLEKYFYENAKILESFQFHPRANS